MVGSKLFLVQAESTTQHPQKTTHHHKPSYATARGAHTPMVIRHFAGASTDLCCFSDLSFQRIFLDRVSIVQVIMP